MEYGLQQSGLARDYWYSHFYRMWADSVVRVIMPFCLLLLLNLLIIRGWLAALRPFSATELLVRCSLLSAEQLLTDNIYYINYNQPAATPPPNRAIRSLSIVSAASNSLHAFDKNVSHTLLNCFHFAVEQTEVTYCINFQQWLPFNDPIKVCLKIKKIGNQLILWYLAISSVYNQIMLLTFSVLILQETVDKDRAVRRQGLRAATLMMIALVTSYLVCNALNLVVTICERLFEDDLREDPTIYNLYSIASDVVSLLVRYLYCGIRSTLWLLAFCIQFEQQQWHHSNGANFSEVDSYSRRQNVLEGILNAGTTKESIKICLCSATCRADNACTVPSWFNALFATKNAFFV